MSSSHNDDHAHSDFFNGLLAGRAELVFSLACGVLLLVGWIVPKVFAGSGEMFSLTCYVMAYFFGGYYALREVVGKLVKGQFEIDFLMLVAATGAALLGEWAEGALLLFLFSIGHSLENYAMSRARNAITALAKLAPETARIRRAGREEEIPVARLGLGDIVIVRSNERLAADGVVIAGESSVDQAPITGESVPVDKRPIPVAEQNSDNVPSEHRVYAGSINGSGSLEIKVTRLASETALARVVKLVSEAETRQSPTQSFTKKFEKIFVPAVILLALVVSFSWLVFDESFSESFYRSMAVLVAASPCALAIATPSAVLSGVARAARGGVLVKGGAPLESLGALDAIAFDKTGTLTEGRPRLVDITLNERVSEDELLGIALAVEALSDHPLARAIARDAEKRLGSRPFTAEKFESLTGRGVSASVNGETVIIGKPSMFDGIDTPEMPSKLAADVADMVAKGQTMMVVLKAERFLGAIGLMDTPRPEAGPVIEQLRQLGVSRMMMISGDNQAVADTVAKHVGLDVAFGDMMPEDKVRKIAELSAGRGVAMVGDGVNDAPAMANATVGIAMGAAGSDVALETADVALMGDDLRTLPFAVGLSRSTRRIIRQNLWVSLGIVAVLIPATLLGLGIGPAVFVHEGSTLLVVGNALRLLAYRPASGSS
ncbi:MAG TPA: heavy metal translocating P-type ATPase [Hyphomonas sp.]|uniref:ATPase P n=2 Tax=Hyphomonadaceae TaxID=69657 RepID=A0A062VHG6_9PROT|nr:MULTISPECIES: heavy metal translocating P-type ATPase [Hyphomonas]KCZ98000.1 ATPase P [Hyphomonas polymorpha PS728]HRI99501.1 heavy metal translocating P-type ATPase [Hyphomonas sp.]HRK65919.1 heavy metal translocating P-type ATPase [Hyphomonas sp.]